MRLAGILNTMNQNEMIQSLRAEISKLQRVLAVLEETTKTEPVRRPGRPKGSTNKATSFDPEEFAPAKRTMSAEGKARIVAAQKKRWAAQKAAPTKRPTKAVSSKSAGQRAPIAVKKSVRAGKNTGSARATAGTKKAAANKPVAKKANRPTVKRTVKKTAAPIPESQTAV